MAKLNFTILFVTAIMLSGYDIPYNSSNCEDLKVTSEVVKQRNNRFQIELTVENAPGKVNYLFYKENGSLISQQFQKNKVTDVEPGVYFYTVTVAGGCKVTNKVEVK